MKAAVIMGSISDLPVLEKTISTLKDFGIEVESHIMSAHRPLDKAIDDIYLQAHVHRNRLVTFYIVYTVIFSIFVATLIMFQAAARTVEGKETIELVPEWALNILVVLSHRLPLSRRIDPPKMCKTNVFILII